MDHKLIKKENIIEKYILGQLSIKEKASFDEHIESCRKCDTELHKLIHEKDYVEKFVLGNLTPEESSFFDEHYFKCDICFQEVKQIEKVRLGIHDAIYREAFSLTPSHLQELPLLERLRSFFSSPYVAFASLLLLLIMLYPAWQGLQLKSELKEMQRPQAIPAQGYPLRPSDDNVRGAAQVISLLPEENIFLLNFNLPIKALEKHAYLTRIYDAQKQLVWDVGNVKPAGQYETFTIACFGASFKEGSYVLAVTEINPSGRPTGREFFYPFIIKTKK